ncbi:major facilitator superfamily domain-containing protein [Macrophomina phaseolina]|uniref:Major facilitator superfamily domain-containing protein n=1 Tax=Macrophomina phaseolina TaxID=35725 RepID=A0ABQ8G5Z0_9PEZI|nr:major facilitator superfamily domain-containing protein [Macrophomina phaseolina]
MADKEKSSKAEERPASGSPPPYVDEGGVVDSRKTSWKYREVNILGHKVWYASPAIQLGIVSFVCFMCPGMFNALSGMGGGGQVDTEAANKANIALYSTFAVVGFFAGTIANVLGVKFALGFGGLGYGIYVASFLSFSHTQNYGFTVFAGAFLGVCAGLLWCAQGAIMMSYPPEASKGRYISWFWMIFNLGAVIGSLIPLGQNIHTTTASTVSDGTYIGFLILTLIGAGLAFTLVSAKSVVREDGSHIILMKNPSWKTELTGLLETFVSDPYIIALFPMFFASNWFYTYHFNDVNAAYFNTRTRALNNTLYYIMQIVAAFIFGYALDQKNFRRTTRAKGVWVVLMVLTMAIWGGGYAFQKTYTRDQASSSGFVVKDWAHSGYIGPMFLYMFYGFYDAAWQTSVYWLMGAMTNNGRKLANFAGFYKGIQSAGAAIIWALDLKKLPFMNLFASCWALLAGSLVIALPVILIKIQDHVSLEEDLKFTDESLTDIAPQGTAAYENATATTTTTTTGTMTKN